MPEREFRSETPTDTFENEINVAEEASNYDQHDALCENCQNIFKFHNDILCSMCDAGLFSIAKKEESICPSDINVKFAITNLKPKQSSDYTIILSFNTVTWNSSVKSAKNYRRMKKHLRNTCISSTTCITVFAVRQRLKARKIT